MGHAASLLLLAAAALWAGAALGPAVPALAAGPLALAAGLAAWCAARRRGRVAVAWALAGFALAGAALGAQAAPRSQPALNATRARGRWIDARPVRGGTLLVLSGRGPERVFVPRTGQEWLDRFPEAARPGAMIEVPLRRAESPGTPRALSASSVVVLSPARGPARLAGLAAAVRAGFLGRATARLVRAAGGPEEADPAGALLLAMVAGERDALAPDDWRALRASGLAHQAVVSGVQVGVIVLAAAWALAPLGGPHGRGRRAVALAAAAAAMLLLPAEPPVRRAGVAVLVARAGRLAGRGASPPAALAGAAALLLALDPTLARSLSFALTVAATLAIVTGARGTGWGPRLRLFFGPILATWPILVLMTGCAGVWSPVANLLAAPAAAPALLCGWLTVLLPAGSMAATRDRGGRPPRGRVVPGGRPRRVGMARVGADRGPGRPGVARAARGARVRVARRARTVRRRPRPRRARLLRLAASPRAGPAAGRLARGARRRPGPGGARARGRPQRC